jgi:D-alanyl-lipoteichoic acid acyltransferase DltB (MBOAT superfamily)
MLFNSVVFIFVFMPITLAGYYLLNAYGLWRGASAWLVLASAVFYGWFSIPYLAMLVVLTLFNYCVGTALARDFRAGSPRVWLLAFGIGVDLAVLAYFKYMNFFIENVNVLFGGHFGMLTILLPIGISFFTFQKIAYLTDAYMGRTEEYDLLDFSLFVLFFPQLIAGPIVHHKEIIPQFRQAAAHTFSAENLAGGLALFAIGLCKKAVLADTLVRWSDPIFSASADGVAPSIYDAWTAALAFTFQIYFDFSGYTDMALGLALMVGIRLPINFASPYKATSIIDFWRRWHITLSRFLRDYVYIPLGGNRHGGARRYLNLLLTMLIGGLWHGAAWTFVVWGALHGFYLVVNHGWRHLRQRVGLPAMDGFYGVWAARLLTFFAVVVAWVFFRAQNFESAMAILRGMSGFGPWGQPEGIRRLALLAGLVAFVFFLPNSQQLLAGVRPALQSVEPAAVGLLQRLGARARVLAPDGTLVLNSLTGLAVAAALLSALFLQELSAAAVKPFIYFQF